MSSWALDLRNDSQEIALRNEELNRRRLQQGQKGGPLKVTDPQAFARLMAEMACKVEQQRETEAQREAERARREGASYKSKEERAQQARAAKQQAQTEDEARQLERRFDPNKNYYEALGVDRCASSAEIKRAYKKLALAYHPDKHKVADAEQQAAIADKFKQMVEAFDVLSDEQQRGVYDKIHDYQEANPGRGLPVLLPEELAMMRSGIAELRKLRKMGVKLAKHKPLEREAWVSLEKLNGGGMKRVTVERQRVDADGSLVQHSRTFHLVLRKGMQEGDKVTFAGEGEEAVDTHPGDLVFVLRQKPHTLFKRSGRCNLEVFARALLPGETLLSVSLTSIQGRRLLLRASAFAAAAAAGGAGGVWRSVVAGQGLWDPEEPWDNPPGDLIVQVRYPGFQLGRCNVRSCLQPRPIHLLGSPADPVAAAMVGGCLSATLCNKQLAEELMEGEGPGVGGSCAGGGHASEEQRGEAGPSTWAAARPARAAAAACGRQHNRPLAVCLCIGRVEHGGGGTLLPLGPSPAAQAVLAALRKRVPGLTTRCLTLPVSGQGPGEQAGAAADKAAAGPTLEPAAHLGLLDDEWCALHEAEVVILDMVGYEAHTLEEQKLSQQPQEPSSSTNPRAVHARHAAEIELSWLDGSEEGVGLRQALWEVFWLGARLVGIGGACALLGRHAQHGAQRSAAAAPPPILPWYILRAGGGEAGWGALHAALQHAASGDSSGSGVVGVGVMEGSACIVDPHTGNAELFVAPTRDTLVGTARWTASPQGSQGAAGLQEADDDYGFFYAASS